jgi:HPt (histidine-containing phosphotransfer) domain-containing protein
MNAVLDHTGALERIDGDVELFEELVQLFLEQLPDLMRQLHAALIAGDGPTVRLCAHSLKGAAGNIGGLAVQQTAQVVELLGRDRRLEEAAAILPVLEKEVSELAAALRGLH